MEEEVWEIDITRSYFHIAIGYYYPINFNFNNLPRYVRDCIFNQDLLFYEGIGDYYIYVNYNLDAA